MIAAEVRKAPWILSGILLLAFVLRFWAVEFGLPHLYHADEPVVVNHALAFGTGDFHPHFFNIPPLVSYLLFVVYGFYFLVGKAIGLFSSVNDLQLLFFRDPSSFYLIARILFGVLLGTVSVLALYRAVKTVLSPFRAIGAAGLFAVCFLHVRDSHYIYADIPLLGVMIAAMGAILRGPEKEGGGKYDLGVGAWAGAAAAVKYNGIFILLPYLYLTFKGRPLARNIRGWLFCGIAAVAVFFLLNPYAGLDWRFFIQEITEESHAHRGGVDWLLHLRQSLAGGIGWPILILGALGILRAFGSRSRALEAISVFVLGYYVVIVFWGQPHDRYVLPLIPFLAVLAAEAMGDIGDRVLKPLGRGILLAGLMGTAAFPNIVKSVKWNLLMSAEDVRTVAAKWIEANFPAGTKIALDGTFFMPRLRFSEAQLLEKRQQATKDPHFSNTQIRKLDFLLAEERARKRGYELYFLSDRSGASPFLYANPILPYDPEALAERGIDYVILARLAPDARGSLLEARLAEEYEKVREFNPYRTGRERPIMNSLTGGPFLWQDIRERDRNGQPILIYRRKSASSETPS